MVFRPLFRVLFFFHLLPLWSRIRFPKFPMDWNQHHVCCGREYLFGGRNRNLGIPCPDSFKRDGRSDSFQILGLTNCDSTFPLVTRLRIPFVKLAWQVEPRHFKVCHLSAPPCFLDTILHHDHGPSDYISPET